jgi:hypothetical protein
MGYRRARQSLKRNLCVVTMLPSTQYHGKVCRRCGGDVRFKSDDSCLQCRRNQVRKARAAGRRPRKNNVYAGGLPCRHHGRVLRYKSNDQCVLCVKETYRRLNAHRVPQAEVGRKAKTSNRKRAITQGRSRYRGSPCKVCGRTLRYISGSCVWCKNRAHETPDQRERRLARARSYRLQCVRARKVLKELGLEL